MREGNSFNTAASNPFNTISFPNYSRPSFADIDNDNDYDLILGKSFGELNCYENIGNAQSPEWLRNDALISNMEVKQNSAPGFADLDNDGRIDCVIGEYDGNFTYYKNLFAPTSLNNDISPEPSNFYLSQNFPNPFNPSTKIRFTIPQDVILSEAKNLLVTLKVYDILGNEVAALLEEYKPAGTYEVEFSVGQPFSLSSGVYYYQLISNEFVQTKKMILMK
ncbi:MAG: T9SS type A sorting domain-containing protein [Ignavibacteriaceae bacterium]|nr:T9SS type A sorting domain-containing protein [Ignavibacteriaceae bacterium]